MSQENVEIIRDTFGRFKAGDERWIDVVHPEISWDFSAYPAPDIPVRGSGREGLLTEVMATYFSGWRAYESEITEIVDAGDDIVVGLHEVVRVSDSDDALERETFHVWTIRDGKWVGWRFFLDRADALDAIGLTE